MTDKSDMQLIDNDLFDTEITINPNFYIHSALVLAQRALMSENLIDGMSKYIHLINNAEVLARSARIISDDYDEAIKAFKDSDDYKNVPESIKNNKLANKKLGLITSALFDSGKVTEKLIL